MSVASLLLVNEGPVDRTIRVIVGVVLLALVFVGPHTAWGYLGIVPIITGLSGRCPAYSIFGFNTCSMRAAGSRK